MISKNRLFILLCILNMKVLDIFGDDKDKSFYAKFSEKMLKFTGADAPPRRQQQQEQQPPKQQQEPEIGSWTATKALLRNAGRSIVGPIIEGTLGIISYGLQSATESLSGDENKERRDNIYTATAGALSAWTLYRWYQGESIIPFKTSITDWWKNKVYPGAQYFFNANAQIINAQNNH